MFNIPTHMDFAGQAKAERRSRSIITWFGIVGLIWGGVAQQFSLTFAILFLGFLVASIITIPPWSAYRLKPLNWQKPKTESDDPKKK